MDEKQVQKAREWLAKQPDAWDAIKRATSVCDVARLCAAYHESIFWVADTSNALAEKAATELTKTGPLNRFIFSDVKRPLAKDRMYRFHNFEKDGPPEGKFWWKKLRENTLKAELDYWAGTRFQICKIDGNGLK